jgi:glycosyltransferase involved in cell wall biosynthesis
MEKSGAEPKRNLVVEGWRFIGHSYAIVNQWQLLALLQRKDVALWVRDVPFFNPNWKRMQGLFAPEQEAALAALPTAAADARPHTTLRIRYPYDFSPAARGRTAVFGTAEFGIVPPSYRTGPSDFASLAGDEGFTVITPSRWSAQGFLRLGLRADQVVVVPHGVDPTLYRPDADSRATARRELNLGGFVFLSIGAMTGNKGMSLLLRAFARVVEKHSDATLVLKGADDLYGSLAMLRSLLPQMPAHEQNAILKRLVYLGKTFSMRQMARIYRLADAYVTPYHAEGFNMPVLEAAASGLPVICTRGGPTDEFVTDAFARRIRSTLRAGRKEGMDGVLLEPDLEHLTALMLEVIDNDAWRTAAARAGPAHAAAHYTWDVIAGRLMEALFGRPGFPDGP